MMTTGAQTGYEILKLAILQRQCCPATFKRSKFPSLSSMMCIQEYPETYVTLRNN